MTVKLGVAVGVVLILGVGAQSLRRTTMQVAPDWPDFIDGLDVALSGLQREVLPLAETEFKKKNIDYILRFDEVLYERVRFPKGDVDVYVAYWRPASQRPRFVADHTPDVCWVGSGFVEKRRDEEFQIGDGYKHGQYRGFLAGGSLVNVWFWHLWGGRLSGYVEGHASRGNNFLRSFSDDCLLPLSEQYFVRIHSASAWDDLWCDVRFRRMVAALGRAGFGS